VLVPVLVLGHLRVLVVPVLVPVLVLVLVFVEFRLY
jgi:hypothetical protein